MVLCLQIQFRQADSEPIRGSNADVTDRFVWSRLRVDTVRGVSLER